MNERPEFRTRHTDPWESFEQQLRSLTPRDPAFELRSEILTPLHEVQLRDPNSQGRRRSTWVATLIASWSMGAAAGIVGTVLYSRHAEDAKEPSRTEVSQLAVNRPEINVLSDTKQAEASPIDFHDELGKSLSLTNRDFELQETFTPSSSLRMPWAFLTRREEQKNSQPSILTPRNYAIESEMLVAPRSPSVPGTTPADSVDAIHAPPIDQDSETSLNQRDLMRMLLEI